MKHAHITELTLSLLLFGGCGSKEVPDSGNQVAKPEQANSILELVGEKVSLDGVPVTIAGINFTPPSTWKDLGASGMRKADYSFGPLEGDSDSASVSVFYFGSQGGGGVMDNINRWIGQISLPGGGDAGEHASRVKFEVSGLSANFVQVAGTYSASMGRPMGGKKIAKENYLLAAVVLETDLGNIFFKLTGPKKTAQAMISAFVQMVLAASKS